MRAFLQMMVGLLPVLFAGCSGSESPADGHPEDVNLVIRVAVSNPGGRGMTRSESEYPEGYPYEFEVPATQYENIHTLRVIIVRPDNSVEHNRIETFTPHDPVSGEEYGDFVFKVKVDEKTNSEDKRIYLIANETDITPAVDFSDYVAGTTLTPVTAAGLLSYSAWSPGSVTGREDEASPYIDNSGEEKRYVPMTEFFDIMVKRDLSAPGGMTTQREKLFITRSLVKFVFQLNVVGHDDSSLKDMGSFQVKNITFRNLMQKEYLFPKDTEYLPSKYPVSDSTPERIITRFKTPGFNDNLVRSYTFRPTGFGFPGKGEAAKDYKSAYVPMVYFCESENNEDGNRFYLDLDIVFDGDESETRKYTGIELPNLPYFPRNTVVKVVLTFDSQEVECSVDLVPYIGVNLNPGFGFEELLPGDHNTPNWVN